MNGSDFMNYLDKQVIDAKNNCNYFFVKLIFCVLKNLFKLSIILLISGIFNYTIISIVVLVYTIYSLYDTFNVCKYYFNIINDIKNTLGYNDFYFEIDFNLIHSDFFRGVIRYGK